MRIHLLALCLGMLSLRFVPVLPSAGWLLFLAVLALSALCFPFSRFVACVVLGFCWSCWHAGQVLDDRLAANWDGQTLWIEGEVAGLPQLSLSAAGQEVVRFELVQAYSRRTGLPQRIRLSWYAPQGQVRAGERWRLAVALKQPQGLLNPHAFDYQQWLTARGVGATGNVKAGERLAKGRGMRFWREELRGRLQDLLPELPASAGVIALVLGDGSGLSAQQWQVLRDSGTVHLFVISGQHISLMAGLAYAAVALLHRLALWPMRIPWLPVACGLAFFSAVLYGAVAGFDVPVRRALIMLAVVLLWRLRHLQLAQWTPWLLALTLVLLHDPLVVLHPGFWLSFAAVAVLFLVFAWRLGRFAWWQLLTRAQWAAAVGLLPFMLALGLPVSWLGPLANALAVPFVSFVTLPLALLGAALLALPVVAEPLLWLAAHSLGLLWWLLESGIARLAAWQAPFLPWWVVLLAALGAFLLLLPGALRSGWLVLGLFIPLFWPPQADLPRMGEAHIWLLDVGQGQAILVRTARHALLYDAGPALGGMDAGEQVVVPFLRGERIGRLDLMVLSHADMDHAGGAQSVLSAVEAGALLSGEPWRQADLQAQLCEERQWQWDGVLFALWRWKQAADSNNASCVLLVQAGGEGFLVTGDLGVTGEAALLQHWPDLRADWLVAGHHGSRTSTGAEFVERLKPHSVLISRGRYNHYGHPHSDVLLRLHRAGINVYDTAHDKALRIGLGRQESAWCMARQRRFWRVAALDIKGGDLCQN